MNLFGKSGVNHRLKRIIEFSDERIGGKILMNKEIGIYIHIPFCKSKCFYCDFLSFSNKNELMDEYIDVLLKEIENCNLDIYKIKTLYIGGGTPSILNSKCIGRIIKSLRRYIKEKAEITIEVNPGTVNKEKLQNYIEFGINRLSIGTQSTNDRILKSIGRVHHAKDFFDTYEMARRVGFKNINVDLMLGLPSQSMEELKLSVSDILMLNPEHISIYSLILEEGTILEEMVRSGDLQIIDEDMERRMYWETKKMLEDSGYIHYEISNFAKIGYESMHNVDCWNQHEYIGFGVSAHSYVDGIRYSNTEGIEDYINNIKNKRFEDNISINERQTNESMR